MFTRTVSTKVSVPISTKYLDEFFRSKCAPDVLPYFQCDNPTKEITESMSALVHARKILGYESSMRKDVICLIPGDGVLPRTGALVAHKTKWNVLSIDPIMNIEKFVNMNLKHWVERLTVERSQIENTIYKEIPCTVGVILMVHSHASIKHALKILRPRDRVIIVSIPCCKENDLELESAIWGDAGIYSDKNLVYCWNIRRGCAGSEVVNWLS